MVKCYVLPLQPEPEEDRREEEDTHGHVNIEHEVGRYHGKGRRVACFSCLGWRLMPNALHLQDYKVCTVRACSSQAPATPAWRAALHHAAP